MDNYDGSRFVWINRGVLSKKAFFGEVIYPPGGFCGPRIQRDYQLVVLHSGSAAVVVDGERHTIPVGSIALFLPDHQEYFQFSRDCQTHHSWCSVVADAMPRPLARELERVPFVASSSDVFQRLFSTGLMVGNPHDAFAERVITELGVLLFAEFLRLSEAERTQSHQTEPVKKALAYMEDHLAEEGCLLGALRASGVSRNALIQHFTQSLGLPPGRYLWRLRTERGIAMLAKTGLTVSEIAYQCGFKTPFHFSRLVKARQGFSPREVRKQAWK